MTFNNDKPAVILVVEDVEETRQATRQLLIASGYQVNTAEDEEAAVFGATYRPPDLILISSGANPVGAVAVARRIRARAKLREEVPVVIFCVASLEPGAEIDAGHNVYITRPDHPGLAGGAGA
jgi:CheY-like chemotaxis protein